MFRMKRIAGMAKGSSSAPVHKEDESLVLFGELYKHEKEKEKDVNLLEPMYSVEFEAIQGNGRMFKLPSGKRDYLLPEGERNDYDWLKTPPATPLFPSLEMEANSSEMVFQIELPILQPVRTSRFSSKTDVTSTSTISESPVSNSKSTATPMTRPSSSSSNKNLTKGAAALSNEASSAYRIDKRSSYTPLTNRKQTAVPATTSTPTKATKKTSGKKPEVPTSSTNSVKKLARPEIPNKSLKRTAATAPKPKTRCKDLTVGAKDLKVDAVTTKRLSRPPDATMVSNTELDTMTAKGRSRTGSEPATGNGTRAAEATAKGRRRVGGEREQKQKFGSHAKK